MLSCRRLTLDASSLANCLILGFFALLFAVCSPARAQPDAAFDLGALVESHGIDRRALGDASADPALAARKAARLMLLGAAPPADRAAWTDRSVFGDLDAAVDGAVAAGSLPALLDRLTPAAPDYGVLRAALAAGPAEAQRLSLIATLERMRWQPRESQIVVNIPAYELTATLDGVSQVHRVIVGKPETPTPELVAAVTGIVVNPWWDVPESIATQKLWPQIRRDRKTIRRLGLVIEGRHIMQKPGPRNALGQVKLLMPNPHDVLLHDTPDRHLFSRPVRAFSSGCVRVEGVAALAQRVAGEGADIAAQIASGATATLAVAPPVRVAFVYHTAIVDADRSVRYLPDLYQLDAALAARIAATPAEATGPRPLECRFDGGDDGQP